MQTLGRPGELPARDRISELLSTRRWVYFVPVEGFIEGRGYRVSIVFEGESGHYPTGDGPESKLPEGQRRAPWYWGETLEQAQDAADAANARLGYTPRDVAIIIGSSMARGRRGRRE